MLNKTDEQLMSLVQNGDERAFGTLVNRYLPKVLSYAENIVGSSSDDIIQKTFISVWQNAYSFNADKAIFKTWLYTIIKNKCYTYLKSTKALKTSSIEQTEDIIDPNKQNTEESLIQLEKDNELQDHISNLNKREQKAIVLRYFKELSTKETASIMNSSVKSIEALLRRSRQKLKKLIELNKKDCNYE